MSQPSFHQASRQPQAGQSPPAAPLPPNPPPSPPIGGNRPPPHHKRRLVLFVISALVVSFIVYALVRPERGSVSGGSNGGTATTNSRTSASIAAGQTQTLSALDLRAGDCYNQAELPPADGSTVPISSVELTSCESAHNAQVIARVVYKITDDYEDVRNNKAGPACDQEFRAKTQPNVLADITYQSVILSPADRGSWTSRPIVACVLFTEIPHPGSVLIA